MSIFKIPNLDVNIDIDEYQRKITITINFREIKYIT